MASPSNVPIAGPWTTPRIRLLSSHTAKKLAYCMRQDYCRSVALPRWSGDSGRVRITQQHDARAEGAIQTHRGPAELADRAHRAARVRVEELLLGELVLEADRFPHHAIAGRRDITSRVGNEVCVVVGDLVGRQP